MARRIIVELPSSSGQLTNNSGCLTMHSARETTGSAGAVYRLYDGSGTGGMLLLPVSLDASESTRDFIKRCEVPFHQGLYFQLVSGSVEGAVSVYLDHSCVAYWAAVEAELASQA